MDVRKLLETLHVAECLKDTIRHCTTSNGTALNRCVMMHSLTRNAPHNVDTEL